MNTVEKKRKLVARFHNPVAAWVVLVCGLAFTGTAWLTSHHFLEQTLRDRFDTRTAEISEAIRARMGVYEQVLWGAAGFINASGGVVRRDQFRRYIDSLDINSHWPGLQGVGYAVPVPAAGRDELVEAVRAEGFPDFDITPGGERSEYTTIVFLEPFDWRNQRAFGYDMWSNAVRREAMQRSRDSGAAAISGVITLVQETEEDRQRGFLVYVPVYRGGMALDSVEARRAAFLGWVYSPFRMGDLMRGILGEGQLNIQYGIYDGNIESVESRLFASEGYDTSAVPDYDIGKTVALDLDGRQWQISFRSASELLLGPERHQPTLIAIGGLVVDVLLFYIISALVFLQKRADSLARGMTDELRQAKTELEARMVESERLVDALVKSNEELKQFAYVASHDMKEPLRLVANMTSLLKDEYEKRLDENGRLYIDTAYEAATRMQHMVTDLLEYADLDCVDERGRTVDANAEIEHILTELRLMIEHYHATVTHDPIPTLLGQPLRFHSLISNLVTNALKYSRPGVPPVIHIGCREDAKSLEIYVSDNGLGIDRAYYEAIFRPFKRVHHLVDGHNGGTGFGLAICQKIVNNMGGHISVESTPGRGSTFYIHLPKSRVASSLPGSDAACG